jgi:hypothetical protein
MPFSLRVYRLLGFSASDFDVHSAVLWAGWLND